MQAGYYDSIRVSTDIQNVDGTISYQIGHKHVGNDITYGGCYTNAIGTKRVVCGHLIAMRPTNNDDNVPYSVGRCGYCGNEYSSRSFYNTHISTGGYGTASCPHKITVTQYALSCGHEEGDFIRDTNDMNDVGVDEYIISATIVF